MKSTEDLPETVAAIDLGSNSFHMIVARIEESGTLSIIDRLRDSVRLGEGLSNTGIISDEAQKRALQCLDTFAQRIRDLPRSAIRVAGTNTLRVANNARAFVKEAESILQHPIEIIDGREEARLIYLGVAHGLATTSGKRLVVDIGGGSTELIIGRGMNPQRRESMYTGCVSASNRFFENGIITKATMQDAITDASLILYPLARKFKSNHWHEAIGCAGTIKAIANIAMQEGWCADGITDNALKQLRKKLVKAGHINELTLAGMSENRRPVIAGGVSVLSAVFNTLKIKHMRVSVESMREGLLYDLVGRINHTDVRDATVEAALSRWGVDINQSARVAETVEHLCDTVCQKWSIEDDQIKSLAKWAAQLHEIGLQVSHNNYHTHGAYILQNADLPGFSHQEQALLSALVYCHRSKFRVEAFEQLMTPFIKPGVKLCILLRLAVLLHRGRNDLAVPEIDITIKGKKIDLRFPTNWLDQNGMTLADLIKEINYLDNAGYKLTFE